MYITKSMARIKYLEELSGIATQESDAFSRWSKIRLERYLIDYMLRHGFLQSASNFAQQENIQVGK